MTLKNKKLLDIKLSTLGIFSILFGIMVLGTMGLSQDAYAALTTFTTDTTISTDQIIGLTDTWVVNNGVTLTIDPGVTITILGHLSNDGLIKNFGTITDNGLLVNENDGTIENFGVLNNLGGDLTENQGLIENFGIINNDHIIMNMGTINNYCGASIVGNPVEINHPIDKCDIEGLQLLIESKGLENKVETSLLAPLKNVQKILDDGNPSNDVLACNKLNAFIKIVESKLDSGKLDVDTAQVFIDVAEKIQGDIGC